MNTRRFQKQARQGDVLLTRASAPISLAGARRVQPINGRLILAYGEQTGHNHSVDADFSNLFALPDGRTVLVAEEDTVLEHQEHDPIGVPPGTYEVNLQKALSQTTQVASPVFVSTWD